MTWQLTITKKLRKNGRLIGLTIIRSKQEQTLTNQTFTRWICFLTRQVQGFTLDNQKATQQLIFIVVSNVHNGITCFTQWDGTLLDFLLSNTRWIQEMTQMNLQRKTSLTSNAKSMHLVSHTTVIAK